MQNRADGLIGEGNRGRFDDKLSELPATDSQALGSSYLVLFIFKILVVFIIV